MTSNTPAEPNLNQPPVNQQPVNPSSVATPQISESNNNNNLTQASVGVEVNNNNNLTPPSAEGEAMVEINNQEEVAPPPKKRFSIIFVLIGFLAIVFLGLAAAFYSGYLSGLNELVSLFLPAGGKPSPSVYVLPSPSASAVEATPSAKPISGDDSEETIQLELTETNIEDMDRDFEMINQEINKL